jgi:hypothetical protein
MSSKQHGRFSRYPILHSWFFLFLSIPILYIKADWLARWLGCPRRPFFYRSMWFQRFAALMAGNFSMAKGGQKCEPSGLLPTHPAHTQQCNSSLLSVSSPSQSRRRSNAATAAATGCFTSVAGASISSSSRRPSRGSSSTR